MVCVICESKQRGEARRQPGKTDGADQQRRQQLELVLADSSLQCVPAKFLWSVSTKHHYLWHLAMQAQDLNPRMTWCYANEDFVGKISTIGMSCRHGQVAAYRSKSLMAKYSLGITLRMFHAYVS